MRRILTSQCWYSFLEIYLSRYFTFQSKTLLFSEDKQIWRLMKQLVWIFQKSINVYNMRILLILTKMYHWLLLGIPTLLEHCTIPNLQVIHPNDGDFKPFCQLPKIRKIAVFWQTYTVNFHQSAHELRYFAAVANIVLQLAKPMSHGYKLSSLDFGIIWKNVI